ncbi:agmatinase [Paenibacillus sp. FSL H8-0548]|uniref:agmatinase n=1 Tax=Paenibacillus sp. FSL H8-0548 TaxID=1920422 RepID=UPI00096D6A6D|nr:agmatinase [Paenibacillus sp. FSL H8-0548]OMF37749.1 agmatinase [Paenibacillus sp. FSL H8-0548]
MKYKPLIEVGTGKPQYSGIYTFMHLPHVKTFEEVDYAIIGVPFDTGVSYGIGARFGPSAIRTMSQRIMPISRHHAVNTSDYLSGIDYGDLTVYPGYIEQTYKAIEEQLTPIFEAGIVPIMLGGDHSISLPHLRAAAKQHGPVALVHFDSHTDTGRSATPERMWNHGCVFSYAVDEGLVDPHHSIQMGMRGSAYAANMLEESRAMGFEVMTTDDVKTISIPELCRKIKERVGDRPVFLTFDVDFLDPVYAPGTGTPEVGGFSTSEAQQMLRGLAGIDFIGFDLVEVLPDRDASYVTALNAANIAFEFVALLAASRRLHVLEENQAEAI